MIYSFIERHRLEFHVEKMCQVLKVSKSGFYGWLKTPISSRDVANSQLTVQIKKAHGETKEVYGSRRLCEELNDRGFKCSKNRVAKLMKKNGIRSKRVKKFKATTNSKHNYPVADNLLNQNFKASKPNQIWVSDITYIPTGEGWLYLAAIIDLYNRKVVGWAMDSTMKKALVTDALKQAIWRYKPQKGIIHHSDRGSQYASYEYQKALKTHGFITSMSRKGNCYDNACAESFFSSIKTELIYLNSYKTRKEAISSIFEYIEVFYNRVRLHSSLGYKSPEKYTMERLVA